MSKRIRFVIVEISPECMIAKKGFDEKSVVARVGQPRVLQKTNLGESVTDLHTISGFPEKKSKRGLTVKVKVNTQHGKI